MYWKQIVDGYVTAIGTGKGRTEITESQYNEILAMLRNPPTSPEGYGYRLTVELQWELYELPAPDPDPELSAEEALKFILGGESHEKV